MSLHILWDSNSIRSTAIEDINRHTKEFMDRYPRSYFPQLSGENSEPDFEAIARESHQIAIDFIYAGELEFVSDPEMMGKDVDSKQVVGKLIKYILYGESPLDEAPEVPAEHWERLQDLAHSRVTLAGYRMADIIVAAADALANERTLSGTILDTVYAVQKRAGQ